MPRKKLTSDVISEWDVARRTAEFFDDKLGNLRTYALTTVVTLMGIAYQLQFAPLIFAASMLPLFFLFVDRRYQSYLKSVASYAAWIEKTYDFAGCGLTFKINLARSEQTFTIEHLFATIYICIFLIGITLFLIVSGLLTMILTREFAKLGLNLPY